MSMHGGPMMAMRSDSKKAKNLKVTLIKLMVFIKPQAILVIVAIILSILATLSSLAIPRLLGNITTLLVDALSQQGTVPFDAIFIILMWMGCFYLLSSAFAYFQAYAMAKVTQDLTYTLRAKIAEKIHKIPLNYFDSQSVGDILSRVTNDVDAIGQTLQQSITQIITAFTTLLGILVIMMTISPLLTLIPLISVPLTLGFISWIVKLGQGYFRARSKTLGQLNGHVEETLGAHVVIKSFNAEPYQIKKFDALSKTLQIQSLKSEFIGGLMMPVLNVISNGAFIAISAFGSYLVFNGTLKVGDIQAFIQYNRAFSQPINQVANIGTLFQATMASAERVFEFLEEKEEFDQETHVDLSTFNGKVEFKHVDFGYSKDNVFIKDLNFTVQPGQRVAIVGPTGAGKTTLINLLMRFYDVLGGSIEVDGVDIKTLSFHQLRSIFGMVLQDTWLFNGSLKENICFSDPNASEERFIQATQNARVDAFVKTLPEGYELILNEEASNLSQGQKQLLTIARAFMKDPIIQILDEATSSVDTRTEVLIQHAMETLLGNKTSFIIAHRLSTIRDADWILVLNKGSIIEQGTHGSLMEQKGFYYDLYQSQFEPENA